MESIEIILRKDSTGEPIDLHNMSLTASKSMREILDSLIAIVEYESDLDLKIGLKKGSACQQIMGEPTKLKVVYNKIVDASQTKINRDNVYVNNLNIIRNNMNYNEEFDIIYKTQDNTASIKNLFEKKFKKKRSKDKIDHKFKVEFITGNLEQAGGSKPNFHLVLPDDKKLTIQCSKDEAKKVNNLLYSDIKISAWTKQTKHKVEYHFCDLYIGESVNHFDNFHDYFCQLNHKKGTEIFHFISEKLESYYNTKDYPSVKKFLKIFLNNEVPPTYLRSILIISKAFKNDDYLGSILNNIASKLEEKIGKIY